MILYIVCLVNISSYCEATLSLIFIDFSIELLLVVSTVPYRGPFKTSVYCFTKNATNLIIVTSFSISILIKNKSLEQIEAVVRRFSAEKMFLEISQNSQDNNYARVSF